MTGGVYFVNSIDVTCTETYGRLGAACLAPAQAVSSLYKFQYTISNVKPARMPVFPDIGQGFASKRRDLHPFNHDGSWHSS